MQIEINERFIPADDLLFALNCAISSLYEDAHRCNEEGKYGAEEVYTAWAERLEKHHEAISATMVTV